MYGWNGRILRISLTTQKIKAEDVDPKVDPLSPDIGVGYLRCVIGTCGGAWVGVVPVLTGSGESCGLPMPAYRKWQISAC